MTVDELVEELQKEQAANRGHYTVRGDYTGDKKLDEFIQVYPDSAGGYVVID